MAAANGGVVIDLRRTETLPVGGQLRLTVKLSYAHHHSALSGAPFRTATDFNQPNLAECFHATHR